MLKKGLEKLKDKYDFVFIDCQPSFDLLTQNAVVASDYYIIPTKLDYLSTLGIDSLTLHISHLINEINNDTKEFNFNGYYSNPKLLGVVGNMVNIVKNNKTAFNENVKNKLDNGKWSC